MNSLYRILLGTTLSSLCLAFPHAASAQTAAVAEPQPFVSCWVGAKFGEQPGQLVRGWICERPFAPLERNDTASAGAGPKREVSLRGAGIAK